MSVADRTQIELAATGAAAYAGGPEAANPRPAAPSTFSKRQWNLPEKTWLPIARFFVAVFLLLAWQGIGSIGDFAFYTSTPLLVAKQLQSWASQGVLWVGLRVTMTEAMSGFVVGTIAGAVLGFAFGWVRLLGKLLEPFVLLAYSVPKIALGPLFVIFFGIGLAPKIALAALVVFFLVFFTTFQGVRQVDPELIAISRVLGASRWQAMIKIGLPSATVWILSGIKIALPNALIGAVVGEFLAATQGIGFLISNASSELNTSGVFAGVFVLVCASGMLSLAFKFVEDRALAWQTAGRS